MTVVSLSVCHSGAEQLFTLENVLATPPHYNLWGMISLLEGFAESSLQSSDGPYGRLETIALTTKIAQTSVQALYKDKLKLEGESSSLCMAGGHSELVNS